jgi:hypothetical protein
VLTAAMGRRNGTVHGDFRQACSAANLIILGTPFKDTPQGRAGSESRQIHVLKWPATA